MHRSRVCHFVIDVPDLDQGTAFWAATLGAIEETLPESSRPIYRSLRLPDSDIRILLQRTGDAKTGKERMHLDLETDDVEAEVARLEALGATRWDHQAERGWDFWVLHDPWGNEFCVLSPMFPDLLTRREPWALRVVRHERLTTAAANPGYGHTSPPDVSTLLTVAWGYSSAASSGAWHGQAYVTDGGRDSGTQRAISAIVLYGFTPHSAHQMRRTNPVDLMSKRGQSPQLGHALMPRLT